MAASGKAPASGKTPASDGGSQSVVQTVVQLDSHSAVALAMQLPLQSG
ncbi:MAG TPA: hypothetical protein VL137_09905 [Polyangiaceae bacterium]|nr:hypothetical protein [Polyangiaceae bacterium]